MSLLNKNICRYVFNDNSDNESDNADTDIVNYNEKNEEYMHCIDCNSPMEINYYGNSICTKCGYKCDDIYNSRIINFNVDYMSNGKIKLNGGPYGLSGIKQKDLINFIDNDHHSYEIYETYKSWLGDKYDEDYKIIEYATNVLLKIKNNNKIIKRKPYSRYLAAVLYGSYINNGIPKKQKTISVMSGVCMPLIGECINKLKNYGPEFNIFGTCYEKEYGDEFDYIKQYFTNLGIDIPDNKKDIYMKFVMDICMNTKPDIIKNKKNCARPTTKCASGIYLLLCRSEEDFNIKKEDISIKCDISKSTFLNFAKFIEYEISCGNYLIIKIFYENKINLYKIRNID